MLGMLVTPIKRSGSGSGDEYTISMALETPVAVLGGAVALDSLASRNIRTEEAVR